MWLVLLLILAAGTSCDLLAADRQRFSSRQICKAAIGVVMGRDPATMKVDRAQDEVLYISYVRPGDRKRWAYKCRLDGKRVLWGADDGRWRDHPADSVITFDIGPSLLTILESYSDGSTNKKAFTSQQLGK
jgi:hypothetical protein